MRGFYNARQLARVLTNRLAISDSSILDKPTRLWRSYHGVMNVKYLNLLSRYESNAVQFLPKLAIQSRYFSSGANECESAPTEAVKEIYDKMLNSILEKRSAPPNALLWSMIKECASKEDTKLLFDVLHKLRRFRLSNLRISDNFNDALCLEVTKACVRVQCIDYGKKTLWKHNLYGLTPLIGSAHQLLLYAKQNKDVRLMQDVMDLVKKNNLPLQSGSADIVFGICYDANNWDLLSKYARRFVKAGVKFRQTSINILMDFAAKTDTLTEAFKQQPENAAGVIELLTQTLPDQKTQITSRLEELVTEWPIEVIKTTENKKAHFALNCRRFHSTSTSSAPCRALHDVFVPHVVRPPNYSGVSLPRSHSPFYRLLSTSSVNQSGGSGGSSEANSNAGNAENQSGGSGGSSEGNSNAGNAENPGGGSQKTAEQGKPVRGSPVSWMSFLLLLATGVALVLYYDREKKRHMEGINNASKAVKEGPSVGKAAIGGPFNLVDHTGKPVTEKNFVGKWTIFYFGFTHCPDICPEELQKLAVAIDKIKDKSGIQVVPVFISVDPERDNVEQVREYVKEFHPDLIGLTGSADEVKKVARAYRVYYMKTEEEGSDYLVDHSIVMYLMDPKMEFVKFFGKNNDADTLTEGVIKEIKQHKKVTA